MEMFNSPKKDLDELAKEMTKAIKRNLDESRYCYLSDVLNQLPPPQRQIAESIGLDQNSDLFGWTTSENDIPIIHFKEETNV